MFRHCYRLKLAVSVAGNEYDCLTVLGLDFLRIAAVSGIAAVVPRHRIFLIAQMRVHFAFQHLLQHLGMQLLQKLAYIRFCLELAKKLLA